MTMINANNLIPEFREADLKAYVNANPLGDLKYRNFFPTQFNANLNFASLEGNSGAKVMAPVVTLDSDVQLKGRDFVEKIKGEIPKIEVGRKLIERDFFQLRDLRVAAQANHSDQGVIAQMITLMYGDGRFVVDAVNARLEYMAKQLLSTGRYTVQNGVQVDFEVATQNAEVDWFAATTKTKDYDPIAELQALQDSAMAKGYTYREMVMDAETFAKFRRADSVVKFTATYAQSALGLQNTPTLEQLNHALQEKDLPTIKVWRSFVNEEALDGSLTSTSAWERGSIHLTASPVYGKTLYTLSPELEVKLDETSKFMTDTLIMVSVIGKSKPMSVATVGTAFATPVLNDVKRKFILKTKLA